MLQVQPYEPKRKKKWFLSEDAGPDTLVATVHTLVSDDGGKLHEIAGGSSEGDFDLESQKDRDTVISIILSEPDHNAIKVIVILFILFYFILFYFCFLGLHLQHMDILRPQPQQRQIHAASVNYTTAHGNTGSLAHWARPGIEPATSVVTSRILFHCATMGAPCYPHFRQGRGSEGSMCPSSHSCARNQSRIESGFCLV